MEKEQVIIELIGSEIILDKDTVSLIKFGFRPKMKLTTNIIKEKGRTTIQVMGDKNHFTKWNDSSLAVSDSHKHMSITLDLAEFTDEVRTDQRVEVKLQPLKINISLLPEVDEDRERKILDDGFRNIDLENEKQAWKKRQTFDDMTFPAFFQTMIENQLTSSEIQVNMAQSLSNAKNRIKELTRKVAIARRGRNPEMLANLNMALATYRNAIRERRIEEWHKNNKKLRNEPDIGDLINID